MVCRAARVVLRLAFVARLVPLLALLAASALFARAARADDLPLPLGQSEPDRPARGPLLQGPLVQATSAVGVVSGGTVPLPMGRVDRVIRAEIVPIRLDLGYRIPHLYAGVYAQKSHEKTAPIALTKASSPSPCTAADFDLGATIEYHLLPRAVIDPWAGIYGARRSMWITSDDGQGVRLKGPEVGLSAGFDARVARQLVIGAVLTAGWSPLAISFNDDTHPFDAHANVALLGAGLRVAWLF